jgi:DNA-binding transcriptional regulator YiaG
MPTLDQRSDVSRQHFAPLSEYLDDTWDIPDRPGFPRVLGSTLLLSALTLMPLSATSNALSEQPVADIQVMRDSTGTGGFVAVHQTKAPSLLAEQIARIHSRSGLTWSELARAFGTTRRTLHNWANGRRMSAKHVETFHDLTRLVELHDRGDPAQTRSALIAPRGNGESPLSEFLASHRPVPDRPEGFSPSELV